MKCKSEELCQKETVLEREVVVVQDFRMLWQLGVDIDIIGSSVLPASGRTLNTPNL